MRLNAIALGVTTALVWALAILVVASANLVNPSYGGSFLELLASIYPGFHPGSGIGSVIVGTVYGLIDGGVGGFVFGWLYNLLANRFASAAT